MPEEIGCITLCPECDAPLDFSDPDTPLDEPVKAERIFCWHCGEEFIVVEVSPLRLGSIPDAPEDSK